MTKEQKQHNGTKILFSANCAGIIGHPQVKKMNPDTDLTLSTKSNSKWITGLNVKPKIIKHLEDNTGENLDDLKYGNDFLDKTPKLWAVKKK